MTSCATPPSPTGVSGGLVSNPTCTGCVRTSLQVLDVSYNVMQGTLPSGRLVVRLVQLELLRSSSAFP
jgi:hypothetical protein